MGTPDHTVQFYESDETLLDELEEFVGSGLAAGEGVVLIATADHRHRVEQRLERGDVDVRAAKARGQYVPYDAEETLNSFMERGMPDRRRFVQAISPALARAARDRRGVRAFGEMVALLWAKGNEAAALRLEELWNELGRTRAFSLVCAYPMKGFRGVAHRQGFLDVCAAHGRVVPAESYPALAPAEQRERAIALLQQKAASWDDVVQAGRPSTT